MFYIWHTLLVTAFLGIAYYLGFKHGVKAKAIKKSKAKVWKALKQPTVVQDNSMGRMPVPNLETSHEDWIKGYNKWQKTNQKQNDLTQK